MRRTLSITVITIIAILAVIPAQASWVSHWVGELDKLVRGETYTMKYPGMIVQATEYLPEGTSHPALSVRPHPDSAYFLQGVTVVFDITFLTGDENGRAGQVMVSKPYSCFGSQDNRGLEIKGAKDSGGMEIIEIFPKNTKHLSFVWETAGDPVGAYSYLVELFGRSKHQKYGEIVIPAFLSNEFLKVKEALKEAPDDELSRYGLKRLSQVMIRNTQGWSGNIYLKDGGCLTDACLPRAPEPGMAIAVLSGNEVLAGGEVVSVGNNSATIDMPYSPLRGYSASQLTVKLAVWSPVRVAHRRELTDEEKSWVNGFPDIVGKNSKNRLRDVVRELTSLDVVHVGPRQPSTHYFGLIQAVTVNKGVWIPVDLPKEVADEISVIGWAAGGSPVFDATELYRETVRRPGVLVVLWNLNPPRIRNSNSQYQNQQQQQEQQQQQQQQQDQSAVIDP